MEYVANQEDFNRFKELASLVESRWEHATEEELDEWDELLDLFTDACDNCNGSGAVMHSGHLADCPCCDGKGYTYNELYKQIEDK